MPLRGESTSAAELDTQTTLTLPGSDAWAVLMSVGVSSFVKRK